MRRTKIVCTIGPASEGLEVLEQMILAGMDIARLNFSHGTHAEHARRIANIRAVSKKLGKYVAIMLDTKGPEIRTGLLEKSPLILENGERITLTTMDIKGRKGLIPVSYQYLKEDVRPGDTILIDDGKINLEVEKIESEGVVCRVLVGGELKERKGVNIPGVSVRLPAVTEKDVEDLRFGIAQGVDFIAASFIRKAADVLEIRRILEEGKSDAMIIAKIEHSDAVKNLDEIIAVADGIMVARGDLGVELPTEEVPLVQKTIIEKCNRLGKPVITATQMLESMMLNPRPTRAEANDVANAIFDGTDATMLSGESAAGKYPVEAVLTMARIAGRADEELCAKGILPRREIETQLTVADAISHATCQAAKDLQAAAIITPTESGSTARMVAKYRPGAPIIAPTPHESVLRKLRLIWGVYPLLVEPSRNTDEMIDRAVQAALKAGLILPGDLLVITAGVPIGVPGATNLLKVHVASEVICRGAGIGKKTAAGKVRLVRGKEDVENFLPGEIMVTYSVDCENAELVGKAAAVIAEEGGLTSSAAIAAINYGIPAVVGVEGATGILKDGEDVTVDAIRGLVYRGYAHVL